MLGSLSLVGKCTNGNHCDTLVSELKTNRVCREGWGICLKSVGADSDLREEDWKRTRTKEKHTVEYWHRKRLWQYLFNKLTSDQTFVQQLSTPLLPFSSSPPTPLFLLLRSPLNNIMTANQPPSPRLRCRSERQLGKLRGDSWETMNRQAYFHVLRATSYKLEGKFRQDEILRCVNKEWYQHVTLGRKKRPRFEIHKAKLI